VDESDQLTANVLGEAADGKASVCRAVEAETISAADKILEREDMPSF